MEIIGRISKGSKMDQVYIPKNRAGFSIGNYVIIRPLEEKKPVEKLYFYGIKNIEPIKIEIIREIMGIIDKNIENCENIIITGSFLDHGFQFNDIDLIIITKGRLNTNRICIGIKNKTGIKAHILTLGNKALVKGLETDPLYQMMLSKCISQKRFLYKAKHRISYALLDLYLLKSKALIDNFEVLTGNEKYNLTRNMVAIYLYLKNRKTNKELVDTEIKKGFNLNDINELKQNTINKKIFLKKYRLIYDEVFGQILKGMENGAK